MNGFGWRRQARRPGTYLALGVAMIAIYLSVVLEMDMLVIALAGLYLALVLRRLILNPARGFRIGRDTIDWFNGRVSRHVPLSDLDGVSIGRSETGKTVCVLRLRDGQTTALPGVERYDPRELMHEFGRRGIPIRA